VHHQAWQLIGIQSGPQERYLLSYLALAVLMF
jgi:hypothetical protein